MTPLDPTTRVVRAAIESDTQHGAVMPPLYLASNFAFEGLERPRPYDYTRSGNPTRDQLGDALADLEGGRQAVLTSSGMSAIAVVLQLLGTDDVLVVPRDAYGGTRRLIDTWAARGRFRLVLVDAREDDAYERAIRVNRPRMVWIENPSNPLLRITDIARVAAAARAAGALTVVDNTFLSPVLSKPLAQGADVVVHSTTKYLNGHSDVVGGAIVTGDAPRADGVPEDLGEALAWWANATGATGAPFDAWLTLRGLRTLPARIALHEQNARAVADALAAHPAVRVVHYPGLRDHPGHAVASRQQQGFGGVVSFELEHGKLAVRRFLEGLRCFTLAESLGGVESLVAHPASMTHACLTPAQLEEAGIGQGLLRLSVGIEAADDLLADLEAALDRAGAAAQRERVSARSSCRTVSP
ncbi:MAG: cystathionine gamma-synthase [Planctomycetota bacterium]|nr:cystathionine gamma-synthase [Planctomycetota bacterium]